MDNFNMYQSYRPAFESLEGEQCKELILALFDHAAGAEATELEPATSMAYLFITSQMDRDRAAYERKCATNRAIAEKREAKKRAATTVDGRAPNSTNVHERDQYKDKDKDNYKDKDHRDLPPKPPEGGDGDEASESLPVETAQGAAPAATHSTTSQDDPRFAEFWKAYPRKVGKDAARKAWKKRKPSEALLETILAAIGAQKRSSQWSRDNGQYIPNPATWLNQGRWEDNLEPAGGPGSPPPNTSNPFLMEDL